MSAQKGKIPLTGNHSGGVLKTSFLPPEAQVLNTAGIIPWYFTLQSREGQPSGVLFMICMMIGKGLHRKQK
jgi:hypothetical protein